MKKTYILSLIIILFACSKEAENKSSGQISSDLIILEEAQVREAQIKTGKIKKLPVGSYIAATGVVDVPPNNRAEVYSFLDAYVEKIHVLPGDEVVKGKVLVTLYHPSFVEMQYELLKLTARAAQLDAEVNRKEKLKDTQVVSEKELLEMQTRLSIIKAEIGQVSQQLKQINIDPEKVSESTIKERTLLKAPIDGIITHMYVNKGKLLRATMPAFTLINREHKHLELNVFPKDAAKLKKNQTILYEIASRGFSGKGSIYLINPNISENNTVLVHGHIDDEENAKNVLIGDFIEARILLNTDSVYAIDNEEIVHQSNKHYLFVKEFDGFRQVEVLLGQKDHLNTQILGPKEIFEKEVVLNGNYYLNGEL